MKGIQSSEPGAGRATYLAAELTSIVESTYGRLARLKEAQVSVPGQGWTCKEIIGHLIDSASNNHQQFVRAQKDCILVFPAYDQDHWVDVQAYSDSPWTDLLQLWRLYNLHLSQVIAEIGADELQRVCVIGQNEPATLEALIIDYVRHMEHHVEQVHRRCK